MFTSESQPTMPRLRSRDRRGRGARAPWVMPRHAGVPELGTPRDRFDGYVLDAVGELEQRWSDRLGLIEYAVEEAPSLRRDFTEAAPLAVLVRGTRTRPTRLVVFRRPIEHRCDTPAQLRLLVRRAVFEQIAELLGVEPPFEAR